jgi:uncharacterized protein YqjF (DUF2071 family)
VFLIDTREKMILEEDCNVSSHVRAMKSMNIKEILQTVHHRPFPLPEGPWVMTQIWHRLLFAHWPLAPEVLRPFVPPELPLDTFEGQCWVSITPFSMTHVRPRGLPPVPRISQFPELNVRTYVILQDIPGVYFFSLDADNAIAVALARFMAYLPYFRAQMTARLINGTVYYCSHRTDAGSPPADFVAAYSPISPIAHAQPNTLDYWLVERYCLYSVSRQRHLFRLPIHHRPWPLQKAQAELTINTMASASHLPLPATTPLLHYAHRQEVLVWPPQIIVPTVSSTALSEEH